MFSLSTLPSLVSPRSFCASQSVSPAKMIMLTALSSIQIPGVPMNSMMISTIMSTMSAVEQTEPTRVMSFLVIHPEITSPPKNTAVTRNATNAAPGEYTCEIPQR